ncbi:MAG: hypothetical protein R2791_07885 [Saprospiraceae bacterium]
MPVFALTLPVLSILTVLMGLPEPSMAVTKRTPPVRARQTRWHCRVEVRVVAIGKQEGAVVGSVDLCTTTGGQAVIATGN